MKQTHEKKRCEKCNHLYWLKHTCWKDKLAQKTELENKIAEIGQNGNTQS